MESWPGINQKSKEEYDPKPMINLVKKMHEDAARTYLEDGDPLKEKIIDYYARRPNTGKELATIFSKLTKSEADSYINQVKDALADKTQFLEKMERFFEIQEVHQRRKEYAFKDRVATPEEYSLGVYADVLESQVRDAVFTAQKKGYSTFQSGFREKHPRDQFLDFYNREILVPESLKNKLKEKSIELRIENFDDRTTITLHPTDNSLIRLAEWKKIWGQVIDSLPQVGTEKVNGTQIYQEQADFRKRQDSLKISKQ